MTRDEAIKILEPIMFFDAEKDEALHMAIEALERKHGKWIEINDGLVKGYCSQCGWLSYYYENEIIGMNYCPNCGANMRGDEE